MKRKIGKIVLVTLAAVMALSCFSLPYAYGAAASLGDLNASPDAYNHSYSRWTEPARAFASSDGSTLSFARAKSSSFTAVECGPDDTVISSVEVPFELPVFGGVFFGSKYNFAVFGDTNPDEADDKEVVRVVRYAKSWERVDSASLYGQNTTVPFDAGSVSMAEGGGKLHVHTSHEMYAVDGINHQANLHFTVDLDDMSVGNVKSRVWNMSTGYVSHSFNQYIVYDDDTGRSVTADHGDAHPRGIFLYWEDDTSYNSDGAVLFELPGNIGDNTTGANLGGLAAGENNYVVVGAYSNESDTGAENVWVATADKSDISSCELIYLTDYESDGDESASNPFIVDLENGRFLVMWNSKTGEDGYYSFESKLEYAVIDENGSLIEKGETDAPLSDCQPVKHGDKVVWIAQSGGSTDVYELDLSEMTVDVLTPAEPDEPSPVEPGDVDEPDEYKEPEPYDPSSATVVETGKYGENVSYTKYSDGVAVISGAGEMDDFGSIVKTPFVGDLNVKRAIIEDGVTNIPSNLFYGCRNLEIVEIPDSVESIGQYAFSGCESLKSVRIPSGVTSISKDVFEGCSSLETITVDRNNKSFFSYSNCLIRVEDKTLIRGTSASVIPTDGSVERIGAGAFDGCAGLTEIVIPDTVRVIGDFAFFGTGLREVNIPERTLDIGEIVFGDCVDLESITVDKENPFYHSENNCLIEYHTTYSTQHSSVPGEFPDEPQEIEIKRVVAGCSTSVIPSDGSVDEIGRGAFWGCKKLTAIDIPDAVTKIDDSAFYGCGLKSVTLKPGKTMGVGVFFNCAELESVTLQEGVTNVGVSAFENCVKLTSVDIPSSVFELYDYAFRGCTGLKKVSFAEGVAAIGEYAFAGCASLKDVELPESMRVIRKGAFSGCESLEELELPAAVTDIGNEMCANCAALTDVTIPDSVSYFGDASFADCKSLERINIPASVTYLGDSAFAGCSSLKTVDLAVNEMGEVYGVFEDCGALSDVYYGGSEDQWAWDRFVFNEDLSDRVTVHFAVAGPGQKDVLKPGEAKQYDPFDDLWGDDTPDNTDNDAVLRGDADLNGIVNAKDARLVLRASAKLETLSGQAFENSDLDGDGKLTAKEARKILRYSAKLEKSL